MSDQLGRGSVHANGFRLAACQLYDDLASCDGRKLDADRAFYAYAYAYTWRHHVELQLKYLQDRLHHMWPDEKPAAAGHKLTRLWNALQPALARHLPAVFPDGRTKHFTRLLTDLGRLDPDGPTLRYERDRRGNFNLTGYERLDIDTFQRGMLAISDYLLAIDMAIDAKVEHDEQMRQFADEVREQP